VCATDVDPLITARGFKYTFRTSPVVESYARDLLAYIKELGEKCGKPARKLAVLSENSIVGQSSIEASSKVGKELGYEIVEVATYDASKTQNFASYVSSSRARASGVHRSQQAERRHPHHADDEGAELEPDGLRRHPRRPRSNEYPNALGKDADNVLCTTSWSADADIPGLEGRSRRRQERFKENLDSLGRRSGVGRALDP
jgi:branched-chain amino acid transport system substrate-binding protein